MLPLRDDFSIIMIITSLAYSLCSYSVINIFESFPYLSFPMPCKNGDSLSDSLIFRTHLLMSFLTRIFGERIPLVELVSRLASVIVPCTLCISGPFSKQCH
jgi:hypothetical protein